MLLALLLLGLTHSTASIPLDFTLTDGVAAVEGYTGPHDSLVEVRIDMRVEGYQSCDFTNQACCPCSAFMGLSPACPQCSHDFSGVQLFNHSGAFLGQAQATLADVASNGDINPGATQLLEQHEFQGFRNVAVITDPAEVATWYRQTIYLPYHRFGKQWTSSFCGAGEETDIDEAGAEVVVRFISNTQQP
jgi:hypothetical protein